MKTLISLVFIVTASPVFAHSVRDGCGNCGYNHEHVSAVPGWTAPDAHGPWPLTGYGSHGGGYGYANTVPVMRYGYSGGYNYPAFGTNTIEIGQPGGGCGAALSSCSQTISILERLIWDRDRQIEALTHGYYGGS